MFKSEYFIIGKVVCTQQVNDLFSENELFAAEIIYSMNRYCNKDWGKLSEEDKQINEDNLKCPEDIYIMGAYKTGKGEIWIISNRATETAGDNITTICFPDER